MLLTIAVLLFVVVFLFLYVFLLAVGREQAVEVRVNAAGVTDVPAEYVDEEMDKPLYQRLFHPLWKKLGSFTSQFTPKATYSMFAEKLIAAGGFHGMGIDEFLMLWGLLAVLIAGGCGLVAGSAFNLPLNKVLGIALFGLVFGMILPFLVLTHRISIRKAHIQKALPDVLDLIYVSVQAGLAFDGALDKVAEKMKGPLVDELTRMLQEIRIGVSRRTALKNLSDRCGVPDISLFTAALVQADQLGVSIANVLQIQAKNVREKRKLSIRELAMKAPVKLVFPLVLFIFPALFVVLLGPAVISIMQNLLK